MDHIQDEGIYKLEVNINTYKQSECQELENECVDLLTKIEYINKKKTCVKKKVEFLK